MSRYLNLGCDRFKLPGFINIDINPDVNPDLVLDLANLGETFLEKSVDFIYAGHVLEHMDLVSSKKVLNDCHKLLKPFGTLITVIPDYSKCLDLSIDLAEKIILAGGDHKVLFNRVRLESSLKEAGFCYNIHISDLKQVPYLLVANVLDPHPDPWQTAYISLKI